MNENKLNSEDEEKKNSEKLEFILLLLTIQQSIKDNYVSYETNKISSSNISNNIMEPDVTIKKISKTGGRKNNINNLEEILSESIKKLKNINLERKISQKIEKSLKQIIHQYTQECLEGMNTSRHKNKINDKNKPNENFDKNNEWISTIIEEISKSSEFKDLFSIKIDKNLIKSSIKKSKPQFDTFKKEDNKDSIYFDKNNQISFKKNENTPYLELKEEKDNKIDYKNENTTYSIYVNLFRNKLNSNEKERHLENYKEMDILNEKGSESLYKSSHSTQNNSNIENNISNPHLSNNEIKRSSSFDKCQPFKTSTFNRSSYFTNNSASINNKSLYENVVSPSASNQINFTNEGDSSNNNYTERLIKSKSASPNFIKQIIKDNINIDEESNSNVNSNNINIGIPDIDLNNKNLLGDAGNINFLFSAKDSNQFYSNINHEFNFQYNSLPMRNPLSGYNYGYSPGNVNLRISNFKDMKPGNEYSQSQPNNSTFNNSLNNIRGFNTNLIPMNYNDIRNIHPFMINHNQLNNHNFDNKAAINMDISNEAYLGKKTNLDNNLEVHHINTKSVSQSDKTNSKTNFSFQEDKNNNSYNQNYLNQNSKYCLF